MALLTQVSLSSVLGLIRAVQMIVFTTLIEVPMPPHVFTFLGEMMILAQVDPFNGGQFYEDWFKFKPTEPVNENFYYFEI